MIEAIYKVLKEGDKVGACELICNEENGYTWEIDFGGDTHCIYIISQGGIIKEFKDNSLTMVLLSALSFYYPEEVYSILQQLGVKTNQPK